MQPKISKPQKVHKFRVFHPYEQSGLFEVTRLFCMMNLYIMSLYDELHKMNL